MKKLFLLTGLMAMMILLVSCKKDGVRDTSDTSAPTPIPTVTAPSGDGKEDTKEDSAADDKVDSEDNIQSGLKVQDYYPFESDTEYIYEGSGNEFAAFRRYIDYVDDDNKRIQTRTDNGGTETVRVLELKDGKLSVIYQLGECYYRENFLDKKAEEGKEEILLMEPLVVGTKWSLPDGKKRSITGTEVTVNTPSGSYQTLEVTTEGDNVLSKDYYAPAIGLVQSVFRSGEEDTEISSSLSKRNSNTPFNQVIDVFYPDSDEKIYTEQTNLSFHTGDITRLILQQAVKDNLSKDSHLPIFSKNTRINSLYLGEDGIVYVDFSPEIVTEMNAGSGYELLILQSITNTLGNYYGADEVYITIDNKPYESGHVLMKKGETFKVKMENVVR